MGVRKTTLDYICESVKDKFHNVDQGLVDSILKAYQEETLNSLIVRGHTFVAPELRLDVVPITPRRYVLRGEDYFSTHNYKIKASIQDQDFYQRVADEFNKLRDDLED